MSKKQFSNYKIPLRNTKSENSKSCPDYIFRTASKYKWKFTPNFTVSLFTFSLSLLSQIPNNKSPTKIGVFLLKRTAFQPLINIKWKVSLISLCMQVNFTVFFSSALRQSRFPFSDMFVAIRKIKSENTQNDI